MVSCISLKNSIQTTPYRVQLKSSSSQNLLICVLMPITLTSFLKCNSHLIIYSLFCYCYIRKKNEDGIFKHGDLEL